MPVSIAETQSILSAPTSVTPGAVAATIDQWKAELEGLGPNGQSIIADLDALKAVLAAGGAGVGPILKKLGQATSHVATGNPELQALGAQLPSLGS